MVYSSFADFMAKSFSLTEPSSSANVRPVKSAVRLKLKSVPG